MNLIFWHIHYFCFLDGSASSYFSFPVAQMVEHGASNAKIMGSIPRETVTWMQCKSLWIKASDKCRWPVPCWNTKPAKCMCCFLLSVKLEDIVSLYLLDSATEVFQLVLLYRILLTLWNFCLYFVNYVKQSKLYSSKVVESLQIVAYLIYMIFYAIRPNIASIIS